MVGAFRVRHTARALWPPIIRKQTFLRSRLASGEAVASKKRTHTHTGTTTQTNPPIFGKT